MDVSGRPALVTAVVGVGLLTAWGVWFVAARVSVYELSRTARVEVVAASHEIDAPVAGRVLRGSPALGHEVNAGDVLLELEADRFALERSAELTQLRVLEPQIAALRRELAEEGRGVRGEASLANASAAEERARQRASEAMAKLKS